MDSSRFLLIMAAGAGFTGVLAGAFGAHVVQNSLPADRLETYHTATRYHLFHALALLGTAWVATRFDPTWARRAGIAFLLGILIFSGSLYVLALTGVRWLGAVTPAGGMLLLAGWACVALAARTLID